MRAAVPYEPKLPRPRGRRGVDEEKRKVDDPRKLSSKRISSEDEARLLAAGFTKGQLYNPYFAHHAARALDIEDYAWPKQYQAAGFFRPVD